MAARFERDVEIGAARLLAGLRERIDLGVRQTKFLMITFTYNLTIAHEDRTDHGIRLDMAATLLGKCERAKQELFVVRLGHECAYGVQIADLPSAGAAASALPGVHKPLELVGLCGPSARPAGMASGVGAPVPPRGAINPAAYSNR